MYDTAGTSYAPHHRNTSSIKYAHSANNVTQSHCCPMRPRTRFGGVFMMVRTTEQQPTTIIIVIVTTTIRKKEKSDRQSHLTISHNTYSYSTSNDTTGFTGHSRSNYTRSGRTRGHARFSYYCLYQCIPGTWYEPDNTHTWYINS